MRKSKERIEIEKLELLVEMLEELKKAHQQTIEEYKSVGIDHIETDGWPTLARGLQFMKDQSIKFVGPAKVARVEPDKLLMPGQSFYPTRKPSPKTSKAVAKKLDAASEAIAKSKKKAKPKE